MVSGAQDQACRAERLDVAPSKTICWVGWHECSVKCRNQCGFDSVSLAKLVHSVASSSQPSLKGLTVNRVAE